MGKIKAGYHVGIVCFLVIGFLLVWAEPASANPTSAPGIVEATAEAVDPKSRFVINLDGDYLFRCPIEYETYIDGIASYVWREDKSDISFYKASPLHQGDLSLYELAERNAQETAEREWKSIIGYPEVVSDQIGKWDMTGIRYKLLHENETYYAETMYIPYNDTGWCMCWTVLCREDDYEMLSAYSKSITSFTIKK